MGTLIFYMLAFAVFAGLMCAAEAFSDFHQRGKERLMKAREQGIIDSRETASHKTNA